MQRVNVKRVFVLEKGGSKTELPDPDPTLSMNAQAVMKFYAHTYPELLNSSVTGPEYKEDKIVYSFKTVVGTKG